MKKAQDSNNQDLSAQSEVELNQPDEGSAVTNSGMLVTQDYDRGIAEIPVDNNAGPDVRPIKRNGPNMILFAAILPPVFATSAWLLYMLLG